MPYFICTFQNGTLMDGLPRFLHCYSCGHTFHLDCVSEISALSRFKCPICGGARNCLFVRISDDLHELELDSRLSLRVMARARARLRVMNVADVIACHVIMLESDSPRSSILSSVAAFMTASRSADIVPALIGG
jgi:hypothetical protein